MTDTQDLLRRFENAKNHIIMTSDGDTEPSDEQVWLFMKGVAVQNREEALADDMQGFVEDYDKRIALIDAKLAEVTKPEFNIGDTVTLDRYNHIKNAEKVKVIGYGRMQVSNRLTYKMDVNGTIIESTGGSIMESKLYNPVPDNERHAYVFKKGDKPDAPWNEK